MPILSDCHLHTSHSGDSKAAMEEMILQGISKGLTTMCFTEHNDFDVYGHLDYVVRYGPYADTKYSYAKYRDILDKILSLLIEKGLRLIPGAETWNARLTSLYRYYQELQESGRRNIKRMRISILYCF